MARERFGLAAGFGVGDDHSFGDRDDEAVAAVMRRSKSAATERSSSRPCLCGSSRKGRVKTGLIRRTLTLFRKEWHGNAEG